MKGFAAFFKKEWLENLHNHRLLILAALFLIFGITNAPLAKYTPELLAALADGFTLNVAPVSRSRRLDAVFQKRFQPWHERCDHTLRQYAGE